MEAGANEGILPALDEETLNRVRKAVRFLADPLPIDLLSRSYGISDGRAFFRTTAVLRVIDRDERHDHTLLPAYTGFGPPPPPA